MLSHDVYPSKNCAFDALHRVVALATARLRLVFKARLYLAQVGGEADRRGLGREVSASRCALKQQPWRMVSGASQWLVVWNT